MSRRVWDSGLTSELVYNMEHAVGLKHEPVGSYMAACTDSAIWQVELGEVVVGVRLCSCGISGELKDPLLPSIRRANQLQGVCS